MNEMPDKAAEEATQPNKPYTASGYLKISWNKNIILKTQYK